MNIFITGGAGYIGSVLTHHLLRNGMNVTVYDRLLFGGEGLLPLFGHPKFKFVQGDIMDTSSLKNVMRGIDSVIHLAALVGEDACSIDPKATKDINVKGTKNLVSIARQGGVRRFIFSSTCSNYGLTDPAVLATEDSLLTPLSLYAQTKIAGEKIVANAKSTDFSPLVLRFATVCGLSPRMRFDLLVNDMARNASLHREIHLYAPHAWRPFVHILDVIRAIHRSLKADTDKISGRVFNVVGENYQKRELLDLVKKHFPKTPVSSTAGKIDPRDYRVSAKRIKDILNFRPRHRIEEAFLDVSSAVKYGMFGDL